jgi:hypothetical protein
MAITLRNKVLEAKIKEIGRRTGLGPSAVIARAIEREGAHIETEGDRERQDRVARVEAFLNELPPPTPEERRAVREAMDDMYDENGLPR